MNFKTSLPGGESLNRIVVGLIGLFLIVSLSRPWIFTDWGLYQPYDEKRLLQIILLLTFAVIFIATRGAAGGWFRVLDDLPRSARRALSAVLVLGILSVVLADRPGHAAFELSFFVLGGFLALALADMRRQMGASFDRAITGCIVASAFLFLSFYCLIYFSAFADEGAVSGEIISGIKSLIIFPNFSNRRFLDQYQSWTLALIVVPIVLFRLQLLASRLLLYLIASGWWALFFAGDGRGKALAMIVSFVGVVAIYRKLARSYLWLHAKTAAAGFLIYWAVFVDAFPDSGAPLARISQAGRLDLWRHGLGNILSDPIFGIGPGNYSHFLFGKVDIAHPHNALVQWAAEWGLPSMALICGLLIMGFVAWLRRSRDLATDADRAGNSVLPVALTASCLAAATHAMVSGIIVMPLSQIMLIVVSGWMLGLAHTGGGHGGRAGKRWPTVSYVAIVLAAALVMAANTYRDLPGVMAIAAGEIGEPATTGPRMWSEGWVSPEPR